MKHKFSLVCLLAVALGILSAGTVRIYAGQYDSGSIAIGDISTSAISTFARTFLDDTSAEAVRTTLGITTGDGLSDDAWDIHWTAADGDPTTFDADTVTAGTQSFTKGYTTSDNHALLTGGNAILGVDCWRIDGGSGTATLALQIDSGLRTTGPFELRVRIYQPTLTTTSGSTGNYIRYEVPFATSRIVRIVQASGGVAVWNGSSGAVYFASGAGSVGQGPDLNTGWVTYTLRGWSQPASGASTTANMTLSLDVGEVTYPPTVSVSNANITNGSTPGEIRIGRTAGTAIVYVAEIAYRRGHNSRTAAETFRGGGFDRP